MTKRIAVLSDIHANRSALHKVFEDIRRLSVDELWFLGDLYGYFAQPQHMHRDLTSRAPCQLTRRVAGNNDWHVVGKLPLTVRNELVQTLNDHLEVVANTPDVQEWVKESPTLLSPMPGVYMAHGAFMQNESDCVGEYCGERFDFVSPKKNYRNLCELLKQDPPEHLVIADRAGGPPQLMLVGHTHLRGIWRCNSGSAWKKIDPAPRFDSPKPNEWNTDRLPLSCDHPILVNPGSVGWPRYGWYRHKDGYAWAEYAILDLANRWIRVRLRQVPYGVTEEERLVIALYGHEVVSLLRGQRFFNQGVPS